MFDIGGGELLLILIVVLVAFGPKKLPELAQSLGRGIKEFKRAQRDFTEQINSAIELEHRRNTKTVSRDPRRVTSSGADAPRRQTPRLEDAPTEPKIQPPGGDRAARTAPEPGVAEQTPPPPVNDAVEPPQNGNV